VHVAGVHEIDRAHSPRMSLTDGNPNDKIASDG
jgi:hypothetical protein